MSLLILADQPPVTWARFGRFGEGGSYGYQMDASGTDVRNRMMHKDLLPATADVSLQTRIRVKSSLVTSNPAFEGLAVRHRGFQLEGSTPTAGKSQKWDSNPDGQGKSAWISEQNSEFTTYNFTSEIPPGLGIDYATWELVLRAQSGQVDIDDVQCRYYYGKTTRLDVAGAQVHTSGFIIDTIHGPSFGAAGMERWIKYLRSEDIEIRKGKNIVLNVAAAMRGRAYEVWGDSSVVVAPSKVGLMLRLQWAGTVVHEFMDIANQPSDASAATGRNISVIGSSQLEARRNFDKVDLIAYVEPNPTAAAVTFGGDYLALEGVDCQLTVADFTGPSQ